MIEREAVRDRHLFSGFYCYLMCFWIVLLTKHLQDISADKKTLDNMS